MSERPIRLMLVDDHLSFRGPITFMLNREPDLQVVAQAGSLAEARTILAAPGEAIDVVVIDLDLPDGSGLDLIPDLHRRNPDAIAVVLTGSDSPRDRALAVEAGAAGILHKSIDIAEIAAAIRRLCAGESLLSTRETIELIRLACCLRAQDQAGQLAMERLTEREREVLQALAEGLSDKEIARRLGVSPKTARGHVVNLLGTGVNSRLQAVIVAARLGAISFS